VSTQAQSAAFSGEGITVVHPKKKTTRVERLVTELFARADIEINGSRPCDIQVHDGRFYRRILKDGTLGFGESYMQGWWDCDDIEEMCARAIHGRIETAIRPSLGALVEVAFSLLLNLQSRSRSRVVAHQHYDLGNDFSGP
jgi:cyclopropane-fatty-acyl-phospholipid synthase